MDLKNNIINKFENVNFNEKYGNDITITIILITLTIFITLYFLILGTIKSQKVNWKNNKCNPFFMPFASIITDNKDAEGKYNSKFIEENFNECLNGLNFEVGMSFKSPLDMMISFIMSIFNYAALIVNQIMSFFLYLLNLILGFFKLLIGYIQDLVKRSNIIFDNFMGIIYYIFDTIDIIKYTLINLLDFLRFSFFLLASRFSTVFVIPSILTFVILSIIAVIAMILAIAFGWLPFGLGIPFIINAGITKVFAIISMIIMIFLLILSSTLNRGIRNSFCSSNLFTDICPVD